MAPPWAMLPRRHHCGFPSWHTVWDLFGGQVYTCTCRLPATVAETFALSRTPFRPAWPQHSGAFTNIAGHWFRSAGIGSPLPPPSARWIGGVWAPRSTGWFRSTHFGGPDLPNCFSDILMSGRKRFVFMSGVLLQWSQQGYLVFEFLVWSEPYERRSSPTWGNRSKRRSAASRGRTSLPWITRWNADRAIYKLYPKFNPPLAAPGNTPSGRRQGA